MQIGGRKFGIFLNMPRVPFSCWFTLWKHQYAIGITVDEYQEVPDARFC